MAIIGHVTPWQVNRGCRDASLGVAWAFWGCGGTGVNANCTGGVFPVGIGGEFPIAMGGEFSISIGGVFLATSGASPPPPAGHVMGRKTHSWFLGPIESS